MLSVLNYILPLTYLFVPGDRPERFAKAVASGADCVILDLEDAVSPSNKAAARDAVASALEDGSSSSVCLRINGTDTPWFRDDCRLLALPRVVSVMLPKTETADAIAAVRAACHPAVRFVPLIETARGLTDAAALAASPGVLQLAFGSVDFQRDLGIEGDGIELLFARSQLVLASRLAGIGGPVDGVTLAVTDAQQARDDALRARRLGFAGKLCIHPSQIAPVRQAYLPDAQAVAWAKGVLEVAAATSAGALAYQGQLIDKPVVERARNILRQAAL